MDYIHRLAAVAALTAAVCAAPAILAQQPSALGAFPDRRPGDAAAVERGKALYGVNCQFCHGADTRGGDSGPSLLRSGLVLDDQNGELIAPVVREGRPDRGMPKFNLSDASVSDLAAYIHSFKAAGYDESRNRPSSIVVGDPRAGEAYFGATCGRCHAATGDLSGIATRIPEPRALQQRWLMPRGGGRGAGPRRPSVEPKATVTLASGEQVRGTVVRLDDFTVTLVDAQDIPRSFSLDTAGTKVAIDDPLQAHKDLLAKYTDKNVHDVTAYLVTLK
jgi:mono/diheme cytochrome c family protein